MSKLTRVLRMMLTRPREALSTQRHLLVFSHMRSRSTVLAHVLGSNPGIVGYRETHISYRGWYSRMRLRADLAHEHRCTLQSRYLLDKVLHDSRFCDAAFPLLEPKVIMLLREPAATIKSTVKMGRELMHDWYGDPAAATDYYVTRLATLEHYADLLRDDFFFIESDDLVDRPGAVLAELSLWLGLAVPLSKRYSLFAGTGRAGAGDPSSNIKMGVVRRTAEHDDLQIDGALLETARAAYQHCCARLAHAAGSRRG